MTSDLISYLNIAVKISCGQSSVFYQHTAILHRWQCVQGARHFFADYKRNSLSCHCEGGIAF